LVALQSAAIRPVAARSVTDLVTEELRRSILSGALAPGQTFSLREIAGKLNVSFIPVREALRNLEADGLVVIQRGRSAAVAPINLNDLQGIYRLRRLLEPDLARRSCLLISAEELDRLAGQADEFGEESLSMEAIYDGHHEFHLALLGSAATAWDIRMLTTLWRAAERYVRIGFGLLDPDPDEHARRRRAHAELVAVFRRRDPDAAAQAVFTHLDHNEHLAVSALTALSLTRDGADGDPPSTPDR
jgi:DNA-binding GntR family transcriptional regulator